METKQIGRFAVEAKEWNKPGVSRIYFTLKEYGIRSKGHGGDGRACYDVLNEQFTKCRNRVGASWEHAIKEAFEL